jgi:protein-S-isoprenylcysteine O-methyltransferase Ste14
MPKIRRRPASFLQTPAADRALPRVKNIAVLVAPDDQPRRAPAFPHLANLCLALLLLGIVTFWFATAPANPDAMFGYMLLALTTIALATIALIRPPARSCDERWWVYLICLASICYVFAYRFDPRPGSWLPALFWGRVTLQFLANLWMLSLGQSYGMLPALREVRTRLLYGYVRHPAYAMYMLADFGSVCLQPSLWNAGVALIGATLFYLRARLEEGVLRHDPAYADYMARIRWRFIPGIC